MFVGGPRPGADRGTSTRNPVMRERDETVNVGDRIEINCEVSGSS